MKKIIPISLANFMKILENAEAICANPCMDDCIRYDAMDRVTRNFIRLKAEDNFAVFDRCMKLFE